MLQKSKRISIGFQSTLPVGGATFVKKVLTIAWSYFNPRSPWGERLDRVDLRSGDAVFQSTLPVGGATLC